ncbi:nuclear transport factor 2 family protein [uncultured Caulobacter sp.]|jgi:ketosteroid isomerase-like protein|uniref:nuclear transport factor 2 family protein n=1 Tax=uncultured Caulobacter sp. TaxID=158749 RepID=UPI0026237ED5|nr:nuclear transport factor 2 family protein [uncultured Caulobacter sp.]
METPRAVLEKAYAAFNARDLPRLRPLIHPKAVWPNTLDMGQPLSGKEAVLGHFARVFATIDADIELIEVLEETPDALLIEAQYSVKTADGRVWTDSRARLVYHFRDGLLSGMTILSGF